MKTQISKENFDAKKRYSGVYQQQGRMLTDADWNELTDIVKHRLKEALRDVVAGGAPRERGFALLDKHPDTTSKEILLKRGILYIEGTGVEILPDDTAPSPIIFEYDHQLDFPDPPPLPKDDGDYIFFADQWQRTVTHLEDVELLDPGLHGADTCTRARQIGQIKWCTKGQEALLASAPAKGSAALTLTLRRETAETDPCDPCASQVDLEERVGNYLFRVEVHATALDKFGNPSRLVLKWSRENGAEQHLAASVPADFAEEHWVYEFFNRTTEHHLGWNIATSPGFPDRPDLLPGSFPEDPEATFPNHPWARRWDGYCILQKSGGDWELIEGKDRMSPLILAGNPDATAHGSVHFNSGVMRIFLEHIELQLTLGVDMFVAGDYWLAQVRESVDSSGDVILTGERPRGIEHRYLKLVEARRADDIWTLTSLPGEEARRFAFPPLTDVNAVEVGYTMPNCPIKQVSVNTLLKEKFGADWPDPGDINPSVRDILNTFLCDMDASLLPFRSKCANDLYPPATRTVDDALTALCDITAEHIAYQADCADGLFKDFIGTVKLALDQICKIQAQHVGFTKPCNTSLYQDQTVSTVQDALALLCNIRADHISFTAKPDCTLLNQPGINTVQDAIDKLCLRSSGGGCRVTVGNGGQFLTLEEALKVLLEEGMRDICLCLLPGDHEIPDGLEIKDAGLCINICGCGSNTTRIGLRNNLLTEVHSFSLSAVEVHVETPAARLSFTGCQELTLESNHLIGFTEESALVTLDASSRIHLADNIIEAYNINALKMPSTIFEPFENIRAIFGIIERTAFITQTRSVANDLAALNVNARKKLVERLVGMVQAHATDLSELELASYEMFIETLSQKKPDAELLASALYRVRLFATATRPATAVAILTAHAATILENNDIEGFLSFYGLPAENSLTGEELSAIQEQVKALRFVPSQNNLQLSNNRLTRVVVSQKMIDTIRFFINQDGDELRGIFDTALLTDNIIELADNHFVAKGHSLTSTRFDFGQISGDAGFVLGENAVYVGSYAPDDFRLFNLTQQATEAATLGLNIVGV